MEPNPQTRNLVILGMHRSGTSMVAGLLGACGWYVGEDDELIPAAEDNPRGFWERRDVVAVNDQLLSDSDASWFQPQVLHDAAPADAIQEILGRLDAHAPWLIKDPRFLLTWDLWKEPLADTLKLYVYRSPLAVATSLARRNGFPLEFGLDLWEFYNRQILATWMPEDSLAVSYDDFAAEPGLAWADLCRRLGEHDVSISPDTTVPLFDPQLDHSVQAEESSARLTKEQQALHKVLEGLCAGKKIPAKLPPPSPHLSTRILESGKAWAGLAEVASLRISVENTSAERDKARRDYAESTEQYAALAKAHKRDTEELNFLRDEHDSLEVERAKVIADKSRLQADLSEAQEAEREAQAKADYLFHELELTYRKLLEFRGSLVGKIQSLVLGLYKWITLRPRVNTAYEDVLDSAVEHATVHGSRLDFKPATRVRLGFSVVVYVFRHPVSSLRSFSWPRLKRAISVFWGNNHNDLDVWVRQRFPDVDRTHAGALKPVLDDALDACELTFTAVDKPRVSIVIPVYNEYRMTVYCLRSLLENTGDVKYEVILADDASTDLTQTILGRVAGISVVRAENNLGFLRNCNNAALQARGDYILLLNNDTAFTPGWLSGLVTCLDREPEVGVVGPMLLYGDGRLQEAGGIIWNDASGWNYGRMDDPGKPEFNYLKEVDYVSGACLLVRAGLWRDLGGFDERFVPAYYEDTDLCFAARAAGYRVLYQPVARIYHFEGVSHGTDLGAGIKQHQSINREKFRDKWQSTLDLEHFPNGEQVFLARDRSRGRRTVLVVDHYVPSYDKDAGSRSTWLYLQLMVELGYNVKFIGANFFPHQPYTRSLQSIGIEVLVGEYMARNLAGWLRENARNIDVIYIHRPHVAEQFVELFAAMEPRPRLIYFGHDLHFLRLEREFAVTGNSSLSAEAAQWKARELSVFSKVDKVYYPSQVEVDVINETSPGVSVEAIPLYVLDDVEEGEYNWQDRQDILFVAGFNHPPNVDGLCWFVDEVMPLVWQSCPQLKVHVIGSNAPAVVTALASERVIVHGYLSDRELAEQYSRARMVAVPLRFGAGVKGKVLEALQHGLPLVTTPTGAEGLPDPESVFNVEETAGDFAAALVALERGDSKRLQRCRHYCDYLNEHFSKSRAREILFRDFGHPHIEREVMQ